MGNYLVVSKILTDKPTYHLFGPYKGNYREGIENYYHRVDDNNFIQCDQLLNDIIFNNVLTNLTDNEFLINLMDIETGAFNPDNFDNVTRIATPSSLLMRKFK